MNYDMKTLARDFWYGKPHQERRLGEPSVAIIS